MNYDIKVSKYLSYVLRHNPGSINLTIQSDGWVQINELIARAAIPITREQIEAAVTHNEKQRFTIEGDKIRANQGHSIAVDLGLEPIEPPNVLYHGTAEHWVATILREGLLPMGRQHVHLSGNRETAIEVGSRHGVPHVLGVAAEEAHEAGYKFYRSANGVWLADEVPKQFILLEG